MNALNTGASILRIESMPQPEECSYLRPPGRPNCSRVVPQTNIIRAICSDRESRRTFQARRLKSRRQPGLAAPQSGGAANLPQAEAPTRMRVLKRENERKRVERKRVEKTGQPELSDFSRSEEHTSELQSLRHL